MGLAPSVIALCGCFSGGDSVPVPLLAPSVIVLCGCFSGGDSVPVPLLAPLPYRSAPFRYFLTGSFRPQIDFRELFFGTGLALLIALPSDETPTSL